MRLRATVVDLTSVDPDRAGLRRRRFPWSSLAPAALLALAVGAVALGALPWGQHGTTAQDGPTSAPPGSAGSWTTPRDTGAPNLGPPTSDSVPITVINFGAPQVTVVIGQYEIDDSLGCGSIRTYDLTGKPAHIDLQSTIGSDAVLDASTPVWLVLMPTGWIAYDAEPGTEQTFSLCGTTIWGADPDGRVHWNLEIPIASGNALANLEIMAATQEWLGQFRDAVLATPGDSGIVSCSWSVSQSVSLKRETARLVPLEFRFSVAAAESHTVLRYLNIDLSDGHAMGVDELFTSPSAGLGALSTESLKLLPTNLAGAVKTAPNADNFAAWAPYPDGLHIELQYDHAWPAGNSPSVGVPVTIPWSALDSLIKPDSPVRDWWTP